MTNAVAGVLPVTAIDGCPATWVPGPVAASLAAALTARPPDPAVGPTPASHQSGPRGSFPSVRHPHIAAKRPAEVVLTDGKSSGAAPTDGKRTRRAPDSAFRPLVVLIDNYDSFTWNLAHLLSVGGARVEVVRNDEVTAAQVADAASGRRGDLPGTVRSGRGGHQHRGGPVLRRRRPPAARHLPGSSGDRGGVRRGDRPGAPPRPRPGLRRHPRRPGRPRAACRTPSRPPATTR